MVVHKRRNVEICGDIELHSEIYGSVQSRNV